VGDDDDTAAAAGHVLGTKVFCHDSSSASAAGHARGAAVMGITSSAQLLAWDTTSSKARLCSRPGARLPAISHAPPQSTPPQAGLTSHLSDPSINPKLRPLQALAVPPLDVPLRHSREDGALVSAAFSQRGSHVLLVWERRWAVLQAAAWHPELLLPCGFVLRASAALAPGTAAPLSGWAGGLLLVGYQARCFRASCERRLPFPPHHSADQPRRAGPAAALGRRRPPASDSAGAGRSHAQCSARQHAR